MAGKERTTPIKCAEPACGDHAHHTYRNQQERAEINQRQAEHPYECLRHRDRHEVLRPDNLDRAQVLIASKVNGLPGRLYWWPEGDTHPGSGLVSAPGFRAHADDFPESTRLTVSARVELPISEPAPIRIDSLFGQVKHHDVEVSHPDWNSGKPVELVELHLSTDGMARVAYWASGVHDHVTAFVAADFLVTPA